MSDYQDRYCYPGTGVLVNWAGINDPELLKSYEAAVTRVAMQRFTGFADLSESGVQKAHAQIFGRVYPFAGQYRSTSMARREAGETVASFVQAKDVQPEMKRLFKQLGTDLRSDRPLPNAREFAHFGAVYVADLNKIHPFPEGNGRIQRLVLQSIGNQLGYRVDLTKIERQAWNAASADSFKQSDDGPHDKMRAVIEGASSKQRAGQLDRADMLETLRARYREAGQAKPGEGQRGGQKQ